LDIVFYVMAHIGYFLPNVSAGNQLAGMILTSSHLAIIALNAPLPARIRRGNGPPALCLVPGILHPIRVRIWLSVALCNIELSGVEIASIVQRERGIGTNKVSPIWRANSCSVEEGSNRKGSAHRERKSSIDLIVIDPFDLVGSIGSDIHSLNVTNNTDDLLGMATVLNVPTSSFAELLQSVVLEHRQPTLVLCCMRTHQLWEVASQLRMGSGLSL